MYDTIGSYTNSSEERKELIQHIVAKFHVRNGVKHSDGSFGTIKITVKELNDCLAFMPCNTYVYQLLGCIEYETPITLKTFYKESDALTLKDECNKHLILEPYNCMDSKAWKTWSANVPIENLWYYNKISVKEITVL